MAFSSPSSQKYDVFLNFRGADVRNNFLGYLIAALNHASLNIFVDYNLRRGEDIKSSLMNAIQDSKVALTIFSEGYASSPWSLDELVKIMECKDNPMLRQKVIPVLYHVTASDVKGQSGVFAQDFANHESNLESRRKVPYWRAAMKAAGRLPGRSVKKMSPEVDVVMQIVNDVLEILGRKPVEISSGKLKDSPNTKQHHGNGSIWTISTSQRVQAEDLNTVLRSMQTTTSYSSPPVSFSSVTSVTVPMAATSTPTKSTLTNSNFASSGGYNTNGVNSYGLGSYTVPNNSVSRLGMPTATAPTMSAPGFGVAKYGFGGSTYGLGRNPSGSNFGMMGNSGQFAGCLCPFCSESTF